MGLWPSRHRLLPRVPASLEESKDLGKRERQVGEEEGGEEMHPSRKREKGGDGAIRRSKKRERMISSCTSPHPNFLARHSSFNWYEVDIWTEVAKYLEGKDLVRLGMANRWFHHLTMEDSIWKYAFLRDLQVPPPRHVSFTWKQLYSAAFDGSHSYCFRQQEKHIDWMRIGGFVLETPSVLMTEKLVLPKKLPKPEEEPGRTIQTSGTCVLTNARTGIWLADLQLVRCPVCNLNTCEGTMQVLDARHVALFLEEGYRNGSWEYEDIGIHRIEKPSDTATGGIFEIKYLTSPCTAGVLDVKSWIGQPSDWQPKARLCLHAVAVNTNLQPNEGLQVKFQAMRNSGADGEVVSIRISQQLI
ncbi:probable F-box protein At3g61730 [Elaeis guineensis]|uniref:Probable F-box protein At3g61730 n=1 Tax=Elaeis guineensis var. tenera TaxID=51953 RepID=A0A6I9QZN5_ELAGV|nr:probable F-box protein At3g61730 [Elaeis guineensis]